MKKLQQLFITITLLLFTALAHGAIISIPFDVQFRDFEKTHPDFDNGPISGLTTDMVGTWLAGGVPVFIGADGYGAVDNATTFSTWYTGACDDGTTSCVNEYNLQIIASLDTDTNTISYKNNSFFPLDAYTDNDGYNHNFFFTALLEMDLIYNAANNNIFEFVGDDDVWVFINDKLVLDIGGIHRATPGSFDMAQVAADLGIGEGEVYSFSFFFAERHYSQSNVEIVASIGSPVDVPEPSTLAIFALGLIGLASRRFKK
jgi:fibro-slime domain-containing protein